MSQRTVLFKGNPVNLAGPQVKAGDAAPDFACATAGAGGLEVVTLGKTPAKARLFSVVPSLDTPVCATQTKKFNDELAALGDSVACYTFSVDTPFAQKRFCAAENISKLTSLSDQHNGSFGNAYGVLIQGLPVPLLARSIFVIDKNNKVAYAEYVPEVTSQPDYDKALAALKAAV